MDLNQDGQLDYLAIEYGYRGNETPNIRGSNIVIITAKTLNQNGEFVDLTDQLGEPYQITAHFEGGLLDAHDTKIIEKHWMNPIHFP